MSDNVAAVALRWGRIQLVIGSEVGVTAMEIATLGDLTRLDLNDLPGTAHQLGEDGGNASGWEAAVVIDSSPGEVVAPTMQEVEVRNYGPDDSAIATAVRKVEPDTRKGIVAEAAFAAWRQRLADAADGLDQLTTPDAKIVGPLNIPGSPLLTEVRADRRRTLSTSPRLVGDTSDVLVAVDNAIVDLRAAVRFGAAGLAAASDRLLTEAIQSACDHGGWVDRLRLLIAAEEVHAIEVLVIARNLLTAGAADDSAKERIDQLSSKYASQRQEAEDLVQLLTEVLDRLPAPSQNPAKRVANRRAIRDVQRLRKTAETYSRIVNSADPSGGDTATWNEAAQTLVVIDQATADADDEQDQHRTESMEDAARALGELFEQALPAAQTIVDDINRQHPGIDAEARVRIVKRQTVQKLAAKPRQEDSSQPVPEVVAELTMAIALLRGIELRTKEEFRDLGLRILARADRIAGLHAQAGSALPVVSAVFSQFVRRVLPHVAESVFHAMGGFKPGRAGTARDAYKFARSRVWRARYDRGVADAATGGATKALQKGLDGAAPRLIVRHVDRSLRVSKR